MDWTITTTIFLSVLKTALCFNIEPTAWKTLTNGAAGFGYQVVQRPSDLLVGAPLAQYSTNGRGQLYKCSVESCQILPVQEPEFAVNMSLGLTMISNPATQMTLACGPTIPKDCRSITMYNGVCFQIDRGNLVGPAMPLAPTKCRTEADIAFLLDGSGSVYTEEFTTMKSFVKNMLRPFLGKDTQFAIVQFSSSTTVHYYFKTFTSSTGWESNIDQINQLRGGTYTAKAINDVVKDVFTPARGSRPNVKRILIVITDGESQDNINLPSAVKSAEAKGIVRFAIGVGNAFRRESAKKELQSIASLPSAEHVFQVQNFAALEAIRKNLEDKIFSIEGSQSGGASLKMEMAQEGISAAYAPGQGFKMGVIGANTWRGGYLQYTSSGNLEGSYEPLFMDPDSYLGYSMTVAQTRQGTLTIVGAPRHKHRGAVLAVQGNNRHQLIDPFPWQFQTGEYFGAVVCAMDVNSDDNTDLVLISAPMYKEADREGRVYVCRLIGLSVECHLDSPSVLRGNGHPGGRFGSSLAVLPDLNTDGLGDVAVGAPLENDGRGSIYIFQGEVGGSISSTYSQRIGGSEELRSFGMSISQMSYDHSGDRMPDLAVGSKGKVILLRSKPVVMVEATMLFNPNQIPTQNQDCQKPLSNTAQICFTMTVLSPINRAQAMINYTIKLDANRNAPNNRAYITDKQRELTDSITIVSGRQKCFRFQFFIEACPEDALNALSNELRFSFDGLPSARGLTPSLSLQAKTTAIHLLQFEINCGTDGKCVDNLKVDFNFSGSTEVKVGIDELLDVTVTVENSEENSYNTYVVLTYPAGLSYRKFTGLEGRIECNSLDSEGGSLQGETHCSVDKPIFKTSSKALFIVSYGIDTNRELKSRIFVTANATSQNQDHSGSSELYKGKGIDVKYSIFVTIESSLGYSNFSFGNNDIRKPLQQSIVVTNNIRALNFTVVIKVPVKLGNKAIWANSDSLQIPDCRVDRDEERDVTDFVAKIKENKVVDCSVASCRVFRCSRFMGRSESKKYKISANLSSGWIEQIGLASAKFLLTSTASLEYDTNQYIFFSTGSNNNPPIRKIEAEIEVYPEPDFTKEIVGGSLGGLALLALITAGLYKAGFFKSKYQDMINEGAEDEAGPGADGSADPPE